MLITLLLSCVVLSCFTVEAQLLDIPKLDVKLRKTGVVKWFNDDKSFSFINPEDGVADVSVQFSAIKAPGLNTLLEGQQVEFGVFQKDKGPVSIDVKPA